MGNSLSLVIDSLSKDCVGMLCIRKISSGKTMSQRVR